MRRPATPSWCRRPAARTALVVVSLLLLAGCGSDAHPASSVRSERTDVPFTGCDKVACTGRLDGAGYEIELPEKWNGTLLLYSHGYRQARPAPPDFAPVSTAPVPAPTGDVAADLLRQGYALAGSAYRSNGWAVADGVAAGEQLHDFFVRNVGGPDRTYLWGDSLGGLVTELLAEKHPDWVNGAAPLCGVLGGTNLNFDLALDLAFGIKALVYPPLKLTGFRSYEEAVAAFRGGYRAVLAATKDTGAGVPKLLLVAALVDAPTQSASYDGSTVRSQVGALVEGLVTGLVFGTVVRYEIEQRIGGNPSGNAGRDYRPRVSAAERRLIETVSPGSTDRNLALLAGAPRTEPDPAARTAFDRLGTPSGDVKVPTVTLHTRADPLVLVQNETVFADKVRASAARTADLVQLYTAPPTKYPKPAPYGAGHCNFTTAERVGVVTVLDNWVRRGQYPAGPAVAEAFGHDPGLAPSYRPGPWPATAG
ncbi:MAG: alpha/beta hydrolase family protein [Mycobacteriales bacterium]